MLPRVAIVGPTAVGKTAVGITLAQMLETEIVSADSLQVYRGMNIGTAKPTEWERAQIRFHAIDVADPWDDWTLADFQSLGNTTCDHLVGQGKYPVIVGGTGLYVRALTTMLDIPHTPPDEAFRTKWRMLAAEHGTAHVQNTLALIDPQAADRIHVNDLGRLIRALEVHAATGITLSDWHKRNEERAAQVHVRMFGLNYADRRQLYDRIESRVDTMLADGFVGEVSALLAAGVGRGLKPMQSLGYRQIAAHLSGELDYADAVEQTKRETRHFARRQLIWFRADARIQWLEAAGRSAEELSAQIISLLKSDNQAT